MQNTETLFSRQYFVAFTVQCKTGNDTIYRDQIEVWSKTTGIVPLLCLL